MTTVFLGTSEFAAAVLERIARDPATRPALVITRPDRPAGRGRHLLAPPVAERSQALGIALEQPQDVNAPEVLSLIAASGPPPATLIVCAFGAMIREPMLSAHEILNVHPSLLPRWRGAAPIERAIMAGDGTTGVCIMRLTAGLDSGPVCLSAAEPIRPEDTYGTLAARLQELGGELLSRALLEHPPFVAQDEDGVSYAEKIQAGDRLLDPARPAVELERLVRALTPHIGARAQLADGTLIGVRSAALAAVEGEGAAGTGLREHDGRLLLDASPGVLELLIVQPPGGRPMEAGAYLRGRGLPGRP